jgi:hypothetical protein
MAGFQVTTNGRIGVTAEDVHYNSNLCMAESDGIEPRTRVPLAACPCL